MHSGRNSSGKGECIKEARIRMKTLKRQRKLTVRKNTEWPRETTEEQNEE